MVKYIRIMAGPRKIFGELSSQAFVNYGIEVTNINYDTTSKVMWGTLTLAKDCIREALNHRSKMKEIEVQTVQGKISKYFVVEKDCHRKQPNGVASSYKHSQVPLFKWDVYCILLIFLATFSSCDTCIELFK
ncbi:hypothetical protein KPL47_08565 [Clostridium estertheticum]|uniref:hypothetical protein n=1 Tax=Clostridium estertheticum TaxID=238834 RepID=UPI001C0E7F4A|nr:hypothetical protein [Clostridium estertheticum]MBU3176424.1 hypothetical protein [Clostridium estertheticum]